MAHPRDGWWIRVSFGGRPCVERAVGPNATFTVGEASDADLVLPGLGERATLLDAGRLRAIGGLSVSCGDEPDSVRGVVDAHPEIEIGIRREVRPAAPGPDWRAHLPWRELLYGASLAVCIATFMAVESSAAAIEVAGAEDAPISNIARFVYAGPGPATTSLPAPPAIVVPQVEVGPVPVEATVLESEPAAGDPEPRVRKTAPRPSSQRPAWTPEAEPRDLVVTDATSLDIVERLDDPELPGGGIHSHQAEGELRTPGSLSGIGAVASESCSDPEVDPKENVDVVFVLDVSTTMGFVIDRLANEMKAVDARVRKVDPNPRYGLVVFVDDVKLLNGGRPYTSVDALTADFRRWASFASSNRQLHVPDSNVDWPENSLDALHAAARQFSWRPADDTLRVVVHATDDSFGDRGDLLSGIEVRHSYGQVVSVLKDAEIRVASFGARIGGSCECEDVRQGIMSGYRGRKSIPGATGGAAFDIDDVASGVLRFADAIGPLTRAGVCTTYGLPWR